ncbi:MAG: transcriptional activator RfaH [Rhodospirillales bacterium]|nr:transcriptional activator RfaH [Rhodospirillales bacterium]
MRQWYAVHTHAKAETKAANHLSNQNFEAYLPMYLKRRSHARKLDWVRVPLFQRYLFVRLDTRNDRWRSVNSTVGVQYMVSHGDRPTSVPDSMIDEIKAREDETGLVNTSRIVPLKKGAKVQFVDGPMIDHTGIFDCIRDEDRIVILLQLMSRQIRVVTQRDSVTDCG